MHATPVRGSGQTRTHSSVPEAEVNEAAAVAVLGAGGRMGLGMARNIAAAGLHVHAWNRTREKAEPLAEHGAHVFDNPAEAAANAGTVVTMLADGDTVLDAMQDADGVLARAGADCVWVQMSTIGEQATERCAELAREHGVGFIDAPVLGTQQPAAEGKLVVIASRP